MCKKIAESMQEHLSRKGAGLFYGKTPVSCKKNRKKKSGMFYAKKKRMKRYTSSHGTTIIIRVIRSSNFLQRSAIAIDGSISLYAKRRGI